MKAAWSRLEWASVSSGIRSCALSVVSAAEAPALLTEARKLGLNAIPLRIEEVPSRRSNPVLRIHMVIGRRRDAKSFRSAWCRMDHFEMGGLLGFPSCCRTFFGYAFKEAHFNDPVWLIAQDTPGNRVTGNTVEVSGHAEINIFWRYLGVRMVPHLPCNFQCVESKLLAQRFANLGESLGFTEVMATMREVFRWPLEWSGLHGIAEVRTPIVKFVFPTDATATKLTVRWQGDVYPEIGAHGIGFPYDKRIRR